MVLPASTEQDAWTWKLKVLVDPEVSALAPAALRNEIQVRVNRLRRLSEALTRRIIPTKLSQWFTRAAAGFRVLAPGCDGRPGFASLKAAVHPYRARLETGFFNEICAIRDRVPWRGVADGLTTTIPGLGRIGQITMAGNPTMGSSLKAAMVSSVMSRARWTAHSSFRSSRIAPTRRVIASSLGKMPTTSVRRLTSPLSRSRPLVTGMREPAPKARLRATSLRRMVRPSGTEAPGARRCGQADLFDEP
jgi:hypothetical protein